MTNKGDNMDEKNMIEAFNKIHAIAVELLTKKYLPDEIHGKLNEIISLSRYHLDIGRNEKKN